MTIFGFNGVNQTPDDGNSVRNSQGNDKTKKNKSYDEQIEEINEKIQELRDSIDFYQTPEEFAEIQKKIKTLEECRYKLLMKKNGY